MKYIRHFDSQEDYEAFTSSLPNVLVAGPDGVGIRGNMSVDKTLTRWYKDGVLVKEYDVDGVISESLMQEIGVEGQYDTCIIGENVQTIGDTAFELHSVQIDGVNVPTCGNHYYIPKTVAIIGWHAFGNYGLGANDDPLDITYEGTKNEWSENISKQNIWYNFNDDCSRGIIHCKDGDMDISYDNGNGGGIG